MGEETLNLWEDVPKTIRPGTAGASGEKASSRMCTSPSLPPNAPGMSSSITPSLTKIPGYDIIHHRARALMCRGNLFLLHMSALGFWESEALQ